NGKWIMENDCVAFGHYLNYFPEENTTIFNFQLSIFNSLGRALNRNLKGGCGHPPLRVLTNSCRSMGIWRREQAPALRWCMEVGGF
ncbi:MAG: hypothetical protein IJO45_04955, partial [Oscillospiraceae bacterium]|nr:hypothetical protein [Oscillospiraceae bacterium]